MSMEFGKRGVDWEKYYGDRARAKRDAEDILRHVREQDAHHAAFSKAWETNMLTIGEALME